MAGLLDLVLQLGAASGTPPAPHLHGRASDRRGPCVRFREAPSSHAAGRPPEGSVERARATCADELGTAPGDHADPRTVGARSGEDPHHAGSISITSGVWPDAVTSVEPVYWGVGSNLFAFLVTYHQHGEQVHPDLVVAQGTDRTPDQGPELR
jgi:hypothetical protein